MSPPQSKDAKGAIFRIRSRFRDGEEELSRKEILKRISQGKLSGEEEVSVAPFDTWQKLASHPQFYDAFLKRLFSDNYKSPAGEPAEEESSIKSRKSTDKSVIDRKTRQADPGMAGGQGDDRDEQGKTRQIGDLRDIGATVHQSAIDELFNDGSQEAPKPEGEPVFEPEPGGSTALVKVDVSAEGGAEPAMPTEAVTDLPPEVLAPPTQEGLASQTEEEKAIAARRTKRRVFIAIGVAALVLLLVFSGGNEPAKAPTAGNASDTAKPSIPTGTSKDAKVAALSREADTLASNDTPLFYLGALEVLREALTYDEANPQVLGKAAEAAARLLPEVTDPEPLIKEINADISRGRLSDPHFSQFYRAEALVALTQGKLGAAKVSIGNAVESDPTSGDNALVLAEIHYASGETSAAKTFLEQAIQLTPSLVRAHALLARISLEAPDLTRARSEAIEGLKLNPLHPPSYLVLADVASAQNQIKEARGLYETCARLAKFTSRETAGKAYFRLGKLREASGEKAEADLAYRLAYYYFPKVDGSLAEKVKGLDVSSAALEKLAAENEYGPAYFKSQGEGLLEQGKTNEALRFFQAAQLLSPKDALALVRLGEVTEKVAVSHDDFLQVINLYERAIERDPSEAKAYVKLGLIETEQYNWDRAFKLLKQAVALAPDDAEPYVALGKYFFKKQDYDEALTQFVAAKKINPNNSEVLYYAGMIRLVIKKDAIKDAMPFFQQAYQLDPENYDAMVEWLKLKVLAYEKNFAIKFLKNSIDQEPNNPKLQWAMGEVFATNNEYRRAIGFYHKALDLDNRDSKVRMSLAAALQAVGDLDKAVAEYRLASLLDRRNSDGFYKAADLLFHMRNYNQAEEVLKYLIGVTPNYPGAHRYLAKIYGIRRQQKEAIAEMTREVENNPENYKFVIELAELYMEYQMYDKAIGQLRKVTNLPPVSKAPQFYHDKIRAYLLLSRCYRAKNEADSAEASIKLALDLDPNDPELHRELGYVYYALQRDKEGVKAFEFYLSRNPAARDADIIKGLISKMRIEE